MKKKIEKIPDDKKYYEESEFVEEVIEKLNQIIDHLNSQAQPEEKEEWKKRYVKRFGYWSEEIKFIQQLLNEREREVLNSMREWVVEYHKDNWDIRDFDAEIAIGKIIDRELDKLTTK